MSSASLETVRRFFAAFPEGPRALERVATEDLVYVEDPKWPGADTYRGREAVIECWSRYDELLGELASLEVSEIHGSGEEVAAIVRLTGKARESGVPYDHTWGYLCRTEGDRVCFFRAYLDADEARKAIGAGP